MTPRFRRVAVFVGTAAIAAGTGIGVAAQGDSKPAGSSSASRVNGPESPGGGAPGGRFDVSALAKELGVSTTRLDQAMQNARQAAPSAGGPGSIVQALADQLGLSVDKVRAAFDAARGSGAVPPGAPPAANKS